MQFSLSMTTSLLKVDSQAKLINTLFALTLSTYFITTYHKPLFARWNLTSKGYEALAELNQSLGTSLPLSFYWSSLSQQAGFKNAWVPKGSMDPPDGAPFTMIRTGETPALVAPQTFKGGRETNLSTLYRFQQENLDAPITIESHSLAALPALSPAIHPVLPKENLLPSFENPTILNDLPKPRSNARYVFPHKERKEENFENLTSVPLTNTHFHSQVCSPDVKEIKDLVESRPLPPKKIQTMPPWHTYVHRITTKYPIHLILWLKKIAPEGDVPEEEIPLRRALAETVLSPEFQDYLDLRWNNSNMSKRRAAAFYHCLKIVEWEKTPYTLFLTEEKDWYFIDYDAFLYGKKLPLRLGLCKKEDLNHNNIY